MHQVTIMGSFGGISVEDTKTNKDENLLYQRNDAKCDIDADLSRYGPDKRFSAYQGEHYNKKYALKTDLVL